MRLGDIESIDSYGTRFTLGPGWESFDGLGDLEFVDSFGTTFTLGPGWEAFDGLGCADGAMGEVLGICVEGDCQVGESAVKQMNAVFESAGKPSQYASAVKAINDDYDSNESSWSRHVPFSPVCCEIGRIGKQAQDLTQQIAVAAGMKAPAPQPSGGLPLESVLKLGGLAVGAYVAVHLLGLLK